MTLDERVCRYNLGKGKFNEISCLNCKLTHRCSLYQSMQKEDENISMADIHPAHPDNK